MVSNARERLIPTNNVSPEDVAPGRLGFEDHRRQCTEDGCKQCFVDASYEGQVRQRSRRRDFPPRKTTAWSERTIISYEGRRVSWLCYRPVEWGGEFAIGRWELGVQS